VVPFQLTKSPEKLHAGFCRKSDADTIEHYMPKEPQSPLCHIVTSLGIICDQLSDQNVTVCSVLVSYCSMAMLGHMACVTAKMIKDVHFEGLSHCPYSPDIAAYDYHMFGLIRKAAGGKTFDLMKCKRQCKSGNTCS
jgi:hypothetical protein